MIPFADDGKSEKENNQRPIGNMHYARGSCSHECAKTVMRIIWERFDIHLAESAMQYGLVFASGSIDWCHWKS